MDIAEAIRLLQGRGHEIIFDLVGWPQEGDDVLGRLRLFAEAHNIRLAYHGFKSVGPELFSYYQNADLYVIASRSSFEGFPRTIWEAMAHSLPVVATRVGSIPDFLGNQRHALIVNPCAPNDSANAIERVITDGELREKMVDAAFLLVKDNTLDRRASEMVAELRSWIGHASAE